MNQARSIPGYVSVAIALLVPSWIGGLLALLYLANKITYDHDTKNAIASLIVLSFFLIAPVLHVVGILVGVVGLFVPRSPKLMPIAGAIANLVLVVGGVAGFLLLELLSAIPGAR